MQGKHSTPLPDDIRGALRAFVAEVAAGLGQYGRVEVATDYTAMLLEREQGIRLSRALGGSRSNRYEAARALLTKSPWDPFVLSAGLLRRLHKWRDPADYVWSIQVMGLRARIEDDEPAFNVIVISAAFGEGSGLVEIPVLANVAEQDTWPSPDQLVRRELHSLEHLRRLSTQRKVIPFGAFSPGHRFLLDELGWRYLTMMPPPEAGHRLELVEPNGKRTSLDSVGTRLVDERRTGGLEIQGTVAVNGETPDWPEGVYAYTYSDGRVHFRVTNVNVYSPEIDPLLLVAIAQSYVYGHLDFLGAGMYRGPSEVAFMRHLALVKTATAFVMERAAHGCPWGLAQHGRAAKRFMDRFLREVPATGRLLSTGEERSARAVLSDGPGDEISGPYQRRPPIEEWSGEQQ